MSETDNFPKQIPANLMAEFHPTWILPNGHFLRDEGLPMGGSFVLGEPQNKFLGNAVEYDRSGIKLWNTNFLGPVQIKDVAVVGDQIFILTVEYGPLHYEHETGALSWYCYIFVKCSPIETPDPAKWVRGKYQLQQCNESTKQCNILKTFDGGVLRIVGVNGVLWTVEFDYSDLHGRHLPTAPAVVALNRYQLSPFVLAASTPAKGVIDIEATSDGGALVEQFYATERPPGIYNFSEQQNEKNQKIGTMEPFGILSNPKAPFQPLCANFRYIGKSNETVCVASGAAVYSIALLRRDGTYVQSKDQSLTPPLQLSDGRVLVTNQSGKIIDIHDALGE